MDVNQLDRKFQIKISLAMALICGFAGLSSYVLVRSVDHDVVELLIRVAGKIIPRVHSEQSAIQKFRQPDALRLYVALANAGCLIAWLGFIPVAWNSVQRLEGKIEPAGPSMKASFFMVWPAAMLVLTGIVFFSSSLSDGSSGVSRRFIRGYGYIPWPGLCFATLSIATLRMFVSRRHLVQRQESAESSERG